MSGSQISAVLTLKPSLRRTPDDNRKTITMLEELRATHGDEWLLDYKETNVQTIIPNKYYQFQP